MEDKLTAIATVAVLIAAYVIWCLLRPYLDCPACQGGKKRTANTYGLCRRCGGGSIKRIRPGRYVLRLFGIPLPPK